MQRAQLVRSGGVMVIDNFIARGWFDALKGEGLSQRAQAHEQRQDQPGPDGRCNGNPDRYFATAESGPVLEQIYTDAGVIDWLSTLTGQQVNPTGSRGSFSYYDRVGHYLGLHRDISTCDVTLITCLARTEGNQKSGALRLYPKALRAQLVHVSASTPHHDLHMLPGQSVILLGSCIPHEVMPAAHGFSRTIAVLCFEITPSKPDAARQPGT
jgi:hypothetical protein